MSYVEGFVIPVPTGNEEAYRAMAEKAAAVFLKHGATHVVEAWSEDVPEGKVTDFRMAVKAEEGEAVVFAWITWPSKEARERGQKASWEEFKDAFSSMPFDGKRMIFGGFRTIVEAGRPG